MRLNNSYHLPHVSQLFPQMTLIGLRDRVAPILFHQLAPADYIGEAPRPRAFMLGPLGGPC